MHSRRVAIFGAFFAHFGFGTLTFLLPYSLGVGGAAVVGLVVALRPATEMLASVPAGVFSDLAGRKLPLVAGLIAAGLIVFILGELRSPVELAIASAALGLSSALVVTSALALVLDRCSSDERGGAIGAVVAALSAGSFIGFVMAGFLRSTFAQRFVYMIPGLVTVVAGVIIASGSGLSFRSSMKTAPRSRIVVSVHSQGWLLMNLLVILILVSTATISLPIFARKTGLTPALTSGSYVALAIIALAAYVVGGRLSDKWGRFNLIYVGLFFLLVAESVLVWGYATENWEIVFPLLALASVGVGSYASSALALLGDLSPEKSYGAAMGAYDFLLSLSEIAGPIVAGTLVDLSGFSVLALFGVGIILLDILVVHLRPRS